MLLPQAGNAPIERFSGDTAAVPVRRARRPIRLGITPRPPAQRSESLAQWAAKHFNGEGRAEVTRLEPFKTGNIERVVIDLRLNVGIVGSDDQGRHEKLVAHHDWRSGCPGWLHCYIMLPGLVGFGSRTDPIMSGILAMLVVAPVGAVASLVLAIKLTMRPNIDSNLPSLARNSMKSIGITLLSVLPPSPSTAFTL